MMKNVRLTTASGNKGQSLEIEALVFLYVGRSLNISEIGSLITHNSLKSVILL